LPSGIIKSAQPTHLAIKRLISGHNDGHSGCEAFRMHRLPTLIAITIAAATVVGCADTDAKKAELSNPPFYVPTTMMTQPKQAETDTSTSAVYTPLAFQVLPGADDDWFFVGRGEKSVYTALPLSETSAFSIYTYDAYRISGQDNSGYRYTWLVREGVWAR
jgi:hypothetical protein